MNWFYSISDQQNGPVSEEDICSLIAQQRIHGDTLVWNESLPEWQKLSYSTLAAKLIPPPSAPTPPVYNDQREESAPSNRPNSSKGWIVSIIVIIGLIVAGFATNQFSSPAPELDVDYHFVTVAFCTVQTLSVKNTGDNPVTVKKVTVNNNYVLPQSQPETLKTGESMGCFNTYHGPEPVKVEVETDQGAFTQKLKMGEIHPL